MALTSRSPEAEALAAELARLTGETKTEAVTKAVRDRLERVKRGRHRGTLADELDAIASLTPSRSAGPNRCCSRAATSHNQIC
jgi:hypothetical protein